MAENLLIIIKPLFEIEILNQFFMTRKIKNRNFASTLTPKEF